MRELRSLKIKGLVLIIILSIFLSAGLIVTEPKLEVWTPYTVGEGDNLWSIALHSSHDQENTREVLEKIKAYNQIENKTIYPGQELYIPLETLD